MFRVWIRQEVWAARTITVMCGTRSVSWDTLTKPDAGSLGSLSEGSSTTRANTDLGSIAAFVKRIQRGNRDVLYDRRDDGGTSPFIGCQESDIVTLLRDSILSECSVAVDRVYGLIGMTQIKPHLTVPVSGTLSGLVLDYSRPKEVVFADLARYIMRRERSISSILCLQACFGGDNIPSWVPDWRKDTSWKPFLFAEYLIRGRDRTENITINRTNSFTEDETRDEDSDGEPLERMSKIPAMTPRLGSDIEPLILQLSGCAIARITNDEVEKQGSDPVKSPDRGEHDAQRGANKRKQYSKKIAAPIPTGELEFSSIFEEAGERDANNFLKLVGVDSLMTVAVIKSDFLASPYGRLLLAADKEAAQERVDVLSERQAILLSREQKTIIRLDKTFNRLDKAFKRLNETYERRKMTTKRRAQVLERRDKMARRLDEVANRRDKSKDHLHEVGTRLATEHELSKAFLKAHIPEGIGGCGEGPSNDRPDSLPRRSYDQNSARLERNPARDDIWEDDDSSSVDTESDDDSDEDNNSNDGSADDSDDDSEDDSEDDDSSSVETDDNQKSGEDETPDWGSAASTSSEDAVEESAGTSQSSGDSSDPKESEHQNALRAWDNLSRSEPKDAYQHYSASILNSLCNEMKLTQFATCHNATTGDIIVIVEGAVLPIVLRPVPLVGPSTAQTYTFVGIAMLSYDSIPLIPSTAGMPKYNPERFFRPQLAVYAHWQCSLLAHIKAGTETEFRVV
jgi:hypothetical protein